MKWYPRACPVCRGDLQEDPEELEVAVCFMCGRSFAIAAVPGGIQLLATERGPTAAESGRGQRHLNRALPATPAVLPAD